MSIDRAKTHLAKFGRDDDVMEFDVSSATVELAAQAIGCEPERIAKTLSFEVGDRVALVVCAGDARIANPKFKSVFNTKPKMLKVEEAETCIGHAVGGVCPFGVTDECNVYLDESLKRFDTIFPACGSSNSAIELTPSELEEIVPGCSWVDVCRLPESSSQANHIRYLTAKDDHAEAIHGVLQATIHGIYPKYYPQAVVDFFSNLHSLGHVREGIASGHVGVAVDGAGNVVGTGCYDGNHITGVYVLPDFQGKGYGTLIIDKLEEAIATGHDIACLDASLPAACLYEHRGYKTIGHGVIDLDNGVRLVYEKMEKQLR